MAREGRARAAAHQVAQDAERALQAVEQADGLLAHERVGEAHGLLRELIGQDFDVDEDGVPRLHRGTRSGRLLSTVDPEMRHGGKSQSTRFDGFKLSAAATNAPEPLIMAVAVAPASEQDGPQAKQLIDAQPETRRPGRVLGDTAYGTGPVRAELADRGVEVLAPVPEAPLTEGLLGKRDFAIDLAAAWVTCPAGHISPIRTEPSGQRAPRLPRRCAWAARCAIGASPRRAASARFSSPPTKSCWSPPARRSTTPHRPSICRTRPRIERLLGLLAVRYGARKSRYFGTAKARLQATWAAALVNLNPIGHRLTAQAT